MTGKVSTMEIGGDFVSNPIPQILATLAGMKIFVYTCAYEIVVILGITDFFSYSGHVVFLVGCNYCMDFSKYSRP